MTGEAAAVNGGAVRGYGRKQAVRMTGPWETGT